MYDICIVWKGIIWDFLINKLKKSWLNIIVISSNKNITLNKDKNDFYNIYEYLNPSSIWYKNATWNITFPLESEIEKLWFSVESYNKFKSETLKNLWWMNFKNYKHNNIDIIKNILSNNKELENYKYFVTARNFIKNIEIWYKNKYDSYWHWNKTFYEDTFYNENIKIQKWHVFKINEQDNYSEVYFSSYLLSPKTLFNKFIIINIPKHTINNVFL